MPGGRATIAIRLSGVASTSRVAGGRATIAIRLSGVVSTSRVAGGRAIMLRADEDFLDRQNELGAPLSLLAWPRTLALRALGPACASLARATARAALASLGARILYYM